MSSPLSHPLVRTFLASVERRTAALPAVWREELLEDLREEIAAALADDVTEDPAVDGGPVISEERVRRALDWIGTPEEIAADALAEESGSIPPEPENPGGTWLTLGLAVLPVPLCLVPGVGIPLGLVAAFGALVRLWRSAPWVRREKRQATLFVLSPLVTVPVLAAALSLAFDGISAPAFVASLLIALALPVVGAIRLARSAARLREQAPQEAGRPLG
ncbi:HAAS signaling domain-containing protein [Streptomyces violaceusniger]|uniref:HAAS signaling domain-containing protein n=1 Tax=Streptomyces violaceusniger TaxID=68280 RepID=UPI0036BB60F4